MWWRLLLPVFFFVSADLQAAAKILWQADCRDRLPYMYWKNNKCAGPGAVILEVAIAKLGVHHQVVWRQVPWARTIISAQYGEVDLVPMHSRSDERDKFLFTVLYGYEKRTIQYYRHRSDSRNYQTFSEVQKVMIGALRDSYYSDEFNNALDLANVYKVTSAEQLVNMLLLRRIDLAITSEIHGLDLFKQQTQLTPVDYKEEYISSRCISIPRKSNKIIYASQLEDIIKNMHSSGEAAAVYNKFGLRLEKFKVN